MYAINGFNQIAGKTATTADPKRPFYKNVNYATQKPETAWRVASMPTGLNGDDGSVYGMNTAGQMVGSANIATGSQTYHAFIWTPNNIWLTLSDLNSLLSASQQSQWTLIKATGVNDAGWIVGYGLYNGQTTAFLLYPN